MITLDVKSLIVDQIRTRRFQWCLTSVGEPELWSTETFATKREALQAGQVALLRAVERGGVRPVVGKRVASPATPT